MTISVGIIHRVDDAHEGEDATNDRTCTREKLKKSSLFFFNSKHNGIKFIPHKHLYVFTLGSTLILRIIIHHRLLLTWNTLARSWSFFMIVLGDGKLM